MLVLSRKKNESIVIGGGNDPQGNPIPEIRVVVTEIRGDKVRFGIEAPAYIPVNRQEVYQSMRNNDKKITSHGTH